MEFFDCKLNFNYHTHFYATKCLSTLSAMKILGNSSRGLLPIQKWLLYRTCVLPIALYEFQLWFFKGVPTVKNITKLKKIQQRAALWITGAFRTSPSEGIEAITGLIPITLHLRKLNGRHHLHYASILPSHTINSLLDSQHAKNQAPYKTATSKLTAKQQTNLKSPIKDVNDRLNSVRNCFNPLHCKGDRSGRLQEIPQWIIVNEILLQPTSRRFLRELDEAPGGNNLHYILQCLRVPALVTRVWTRKGCRMATECSWNDGSKTQYYVVILDRLPGRSGVAC